MASPPRVLTGGVRVDLGFDARRTNPIDMGQGDVCGAVAVRGLEMKRDVLVIEALKPLVGRDSFGRNPPCRPGFTCGPSSSTTTTRHRPDVS
jgi:hypothetical protein